jgi:hypothetical protein
MEWASRTHTCTHAHSHPHTASREWEREQNRAHPQRECRGKGTGNRLYPSREWEQDRMRAHAMRHEKSEERKKVWYWPRRVLNILYYIIYTSPIGYSRTRHTSAHRESEERRGNGNGHGNGDRTESRCACVRAPRRKEKRW